MPSWTVVTGKAVPPTVMDRMIPDRQTLKQKSSVIPPSGMMSKRTSMSETPWIRESIGDWMMPRFPSLLTPQAR